MTAGYLLPRTRDECLGVQRWIAQRVKDFAPAEDGTAMARLRNGEIAGAVAYINYRHTDIEMVCAGSPGWLTPGALNVFFAYPFEQLGVRRVTVMCHRKNKRARKFVERLGFRMEGVHHQAMPDYGDAVSYGLIRSECKWIAQGGCH